MFSLESVKGRYITGTLDLGQLLASGVISEAHFTNHSNLLKVVVKLQSLVGQQEILIPFDVPASYSGSGTISSSVYVDATAYDNFQLGWVILSDKQGDIYTAKAADLAAFASDFAVTFTSVESGPSPYDNGGSGAGFVAMVTPGVYENVTVDALGRVISGNSPTTLVGYGITDAVKNEGGFVAAKVGTDLERMSMLNAPEGMFFVSADTAHTYIKYGNAWICLSTGDSVPANVATQSDIDAEASARIAADTAEQTARVSAINSLTSDLAAEVSRSTAADADLQAQMTAEVSRAQAAEATLTSSVSAEQLARIAADTAEQTARISAINSLTSDLAAEVSRAEAADAQLSSDLATEVAAREAAITTVSASVSAEQSARIAAVTAEASARQTADNTLQSNIDAAVASLEGQIATAGTPLTVSEVDANGNISHETTHVSAIRFDNSTGFSAESLGNGEVKIKLNSTFKTLKVDGQSDLIASGEDTLHIVAGAGVEITTDPSANPKALTISASALQDALAAEVIRAQAAESTISGSFSTLEQSVLSSVAAANTAISEEATRAQNAELNLQSQITNILSNSDAVALDSLSEIVTAFQAADSTLNGAISSLASTEQSARQAADTVLQSNIDAEASTRAAADLALSNRLDAVEGSNSLLSNFSFSPGSTVATAELDMNGLALFGLPNPVDPDDAVNLSTAQSLISAATTSIEAYADAAVATERTARQAQDATLASSINSKASSADLTAHASAATGVHGVTGAVVGTSDTQALTNKTINASLNTISNLTDSNISASANISFSKMQGLGSNKVIVSNVTGYLSASSVTSAELGYLSGVTSAIQTQLDGKESAITTLAVSKGGTGQSSYTDGQLLIGNSTGNTLTKATLTAGTGISITNGNGSITIAATGGGGISGTVPVSSGGTGSTAFTAGSIVFSDGTILTQDNSNLFWNNTNKSLGIGTSTPNANALLDLTSTTKAFLPPRMTTAQKSAIASPAAGMVVYDTTQGALSLYNGSSWNYPTGSINAVSSGSSLVVENSTGVALHSGMPQVDITGLSFSSATHRAAIVKYSISYLDSGLIRRSQTGVLYCTYGYYTNTYNTKIQSWLLSDQYVGNNIGITFTITAAGQVQYFTNSSYTESDTSASLKYYVDTLFTL